MHKFLVDKVYFSFSSAYYIDLQARDSTQQYGPHVIPYGKGDLGGEESHRQWYCPEIENTMDQSVDSNPKPTKNVTCSDSTKTPVSFGITTPSKSWDFQLGMEFTYCDRMVKSVAVVYE